MNALKPLPILDHDLFHVARAVGERSSAGDVQLSILVRLLISVAKSLGVSRRAIARAVDGCWEDTPALFARKGPGLIGQMQDAARRPMS